MNRKRWAFLGGALCLGVGVLVMVQCTGVRTHVKPPPPEIRDQQTRDWLVEIRSLAEAGDWLAIRGYHSTDDLVVTATNSPISHVALFDLEGEQIVEAIGSGVQQRALKDFVHESHRVLLIRPKWWTREAGLDAIARARETVGKKYDFLGTVGLPSKKRFYCSELATWAYAEHHQENEHLPKVIEPGQLYLWGEILFDSGSRD
ncbi:MAG: YiiX/YebB-like N1pC/P60 family cysteine hydrolase [Deltaproteobacteria bacterium]|nr:YiiX/YebB-like N1pC/P60 family cysteine hydrolase [Deltaproteobacteria bacterium]